MVLVVLVVQVLVVLRRYRIKFEFNTFVAPINVSTGRDSNSNLCFLKSHSQFFKIRFLALSTTIYLVSMLFGYSNNDVFEVNVGK